MSFLNISSLNITFCSGFVGYYRSDKIFLYGIDNDAGLIVHRSTEDFYLEKVPIEKYIELDGEKMREFSQYPRDTFIYHNDKWALCLIDNSYRLVNDPVDIVFNLGAPVSPNYKIGGIEYNNVYKNDKTIDLYNVKDGDSFDFSSYENPDDKKTITFHIKRNYFIGKKLFGEYVNPETNEKKIIGNPLIEATFPWGSDASNTVRLIKQTKKNIYLSSESDASLVYSPENGWILNAYGNNYNFNSVPTKPGESVVVSDHLKLKFDSYVGVGCGTHLIYMFNYNCWEGQNS